MWRRRGKKAIAHEKCRQCRPVDAVEFCKSESCSADTQLQGESSRVCRWRYASKCGVSPKTYARLSATTYRWASYSCGPMVGHDQNQAAKAEMRGRGESWREVCRVRGDFIRCVRWRTRTARTPPMLLNGSGRRGRRYSLTIPGTPPAIHGQTPGRTNAAAGGTHAAQTLHNRPCCLSSSPRDRTTPYSPSAQHKRPRVPAHRPIARTTPAATSPMTPPAGSVRA